MLLLAVAAAETIAVTEVVVVIVVFSLVSSNSYFSPRFGPMLYEMPFSYYNHKRKIYNVYSRGRAVAR